MLLSILSTKTMNPYFPQEPDNAMALLLPEILETDLFQQPDDPMLSLPVYPEILETDLFQQPDDPSLPLYPEISDTEFFQQHTLAASFSAYPNISDLATDCFQ